MKIIKKFILFYFLFISFTLKSNAQCNGTINNLPDTIKVCKNTTTPLNPTVVPAGTSILLDTFWTPTTGLSDPNIINPTVTVGTTSTMYTLNITSVTATNLINNGDFSLGSAGFTSDYIPGTGGAFGLLSNAGQYAVSTNPSLVHNNFANFPDHTTGTGNMLIVNGATLPNVNIWCQTITVNPNTTYDFSAWGASCVASNPAVLQFSINGNLSGTPLALSTTNGLWSQFHTTWFSGANTSITICITDQQGAQSGNDFAIDDISFKEICTFTDSVYFKVTNLTPLIVSNNMLGCNGDTVQFWGNNGIGDVPSGYLWIFGGGTPSSSVLQNPTPHFYPPNSFSNNIYTITLTTILNGCTETYTKTVNLNHPIEAKINILKDVCLGTPDTATSITSINAVKHEWFWGDGTPNTLGTPPLFLVSHNYAAEGTYQVMLVVTDTLGCTDTARQTVQVFAQPFLQVTTNKDEICLGEPIQFLDTFQNLDLIRYEFGDGKILIDEHNPLYTFDYANTFTVTITGEYKTCPPIVIKKNIIVNDFIPINLGPDTSICPSITSTILLSNILNNTINNWSTGENANSISITKPGLYWAETNNKGCKNSDTIWVKNDCFISVPNSFSPNGDGLNDYFLPRQLLSMGVTKFNFQIYNRWGEQIFTTVNLNGRGWDGKFGNKDQPVGVYAYYLEVSFRNGQKKTIQGNVSLLR